MLRSKTILYIWFSSYARFSRIPRDVLDTESRRETATTMKPNVLVIDVSSKMLMRMGVLGAELTPLTYSSDVSSLSSVIREQSPDLIVVAEGGARLRIPEEGPNAKRDCLFGRRLTVKQKEILIMLRAGFRNDDMARNLHVFPCGR
jgi:hypothetical protein